MVVVVVATCFAVVFVVYVLASSRACTLPLLYLLTVSQLAARLSVPTIISSLYSRRAHARKFGNANYC